MYFLSAHHLHPENRTGIHSDVTENMYFIEKDRKLVKSDIKICTAHIVNDKNFTLQIFNYIYQIFNICDFFKKYVLGNLLHLTC